MWKRFIALVLVLCLMGDPAAASGWKRLSSTGPPQGAPSWNIFNNQALVQRLVNMIHPGWPSKQAAAQDQLLSADRIKPIAAFSTRPDSPIDKDLVLAQALANDAEEDGVGWVVGGGLRQQFIQPTPRLLSKVRDTGGPMATAEVEIQDVRYVVLFERLAPAANWDITGIYAPGRHEYYAFGSFQRAEVPGGLPTLAVHHWLTAAREAHGRGQPGACLEALSRATANCEVMNLLDPGRSMTGADLHHNPVDAEFLALAHAYVELAGDWTKAFEMAGKIKHAEEHAQTYAWLVPQALAQGMKPLDVLLQIQSVVGVWNQLPLLEQIVAAYQAQNVHDAATEAAITAAVQRAENELNRGQWIADTRKDLRADLARIKGLKAGLLWSGWKVRNIRETVEWMYTQGYDDSKMPPLVLYEDGKPVGRIEDGDPVVIYNYRTDRSRQITESLVSEDFAPYKRPDARPKVWTMTNYSNELVPPLIEGVLSPIHSISNTITEVLSRKNFTQGRFAVKEKGAHVTYFFKGQNATQFPGEIIDIVTPRKDGEKLDAEEITNVVFNMLDSQGTYTVKHSEDPDKSGVGQGKVYPVFQDQFHVINYADCDVKGHINYEEAKEGVRTVDRQLERLIPKLREEGHWVVISADHGSAEHMSEHGIAFTEHTANPVPMVLIWPSYLDEYFSDPAHRLALRDGLANRNIARTVMQVLGFGDADMPEEWEKDDIVEGLLPKPADFGRPRRATLIVYDGRGINPDPADASDATRGNSPYFDSLWKEFPHTELGASGSDVGLRDVSARTGIRTMGNSEVGHIHLGAGRRVAQSLYRIDQLMDEDKAFRLADMPELGRAIDYAITRRKPLHLLGMASEGEVHSSLIHLYAALRRAAEQGIEECYIHAVTDGVDSGPTSGAAWLYLMEDEISRIRAVHPQFNARIVTAVGRGIAMDKNENWPKTQATHEALVAGGLPYSTAKDDKAAEWTSRQNLLWVAVGKLLARDFVNASRMLQGALLGIPRIGLAEVAAQPFEAAQRMHAAHAMHQAYAGLSRLPTAPGFGDPFDAPEDFDGTPGGYRVRGQDWEREARELAQAVSEPVAAAPLLRTKSGRLLLQMAEDILAPIPSWDLTSREQALLGSLDAVPRALEAARRAFEAKNRPEVLRQLTGALNTLRQFETDIDRSAWTLSRQDLRDTFENYLCGITPAFAEWAGDFRTAFELSHELSGNRYETIMKKLVHIADAQQKSIASVLEGFSVTHHVWRNLPVLAEIVAVYRPKFTKDVDESYALAQALEDTRFIVEEGGWSGHEDQQKMLVEQLRRVQEAAGPLNRREEDILLRAAQGETLKPKEKEALRSFTRAFAGRRAFGVDDDNLDATIKFRLEALRRVWPALKPVQAHLHQNFSVLGELWNVLIPEAQWILQQREKKGEANGPFIVGIDTGVSKVLKAETVRLSTVLSALLPPGKGGVEIKSFDAEKQAVVRALPRAIKHFSPPAIILHEEKTVARASVDLLLVTRPSPYTEFPAEGTAFVSMTDPFGRIVSFARPRKPPSPDLFSSTDSLLWVWNLLPAAGLGALWVGAQVLFNHLTPGHAWGLWGLGFVATLLVHEGLWHYLIGWINWAIERHPRNWRELKAAWRVRPRFPRPTRQGIVVKTFTRNPVLRMIETAAGLTAFLPLLVPGIPLTALIPFVAANVLSFMPLRHWRLSKNATDGDRILREALPYFSLRQAG